MSKSIINQNLVVISSSLMDNNSYIFFNKNDAIIIDPSFNGNEIINCVPNGVCVVAILLTHAHFDHCFDTAKILKKWNCPVYIHEADKDTYYKYRYDDLTNMKVIDFSKNISWFNNKKIIINNSHIDCIHSPGHSMGSVVYKINDYYFVGDTLFYNSYGRTDLGNSNSKQMIKSLKRLWDIFKKNDLILPGHNKWATFDEIKRNNFIVKDLIKKY